MGVEDEEEGGWVRVWMEKLERLHININYSSSVSQSAKYQQIQSCMIMYSEASQSVSQTVVNQHRNKSIKEK